MDVLVAIVDVHQSQWGKRLQAASEAAGGGTTAARDTLTFATFVDQLIVFFNAFLVRGRLQLIERVCPVSPPPVRLAADLLCSLLPSTDPEQVESAVRDRHGLVPL